jgi:hypothetical protein
MNFKMHIKSGFPPYLVGKKQATNSIMEWLCPYGKFKPAIGVKIKKQSMKFGKKLHHNTFWNIPQNEGGWRSKHLHWYQVASYPWVRATRDPNSLCLRNDKFGVRNPNLVKYVTFILLRINAKNFEVFTVVPVWVHPDAAQYETKMKNNLHYSIVSLSTYKFQLCTTHVKTSGSL